MALVTSHWLISIQPKVLKTRGTLVAGLVQQFVEPGKIIIL